MLFWFFKFLEIIGGQLEQMMANFPYTRAQNGAWENALSPSHVVLHCFVVRSHWMVLCSKLWLSTEVLDMVGMPTG